MLVYKVDVMEKLREKGINRAYLRKNKIIGQSSIQDIQRGIMVGTTSLDKICGLLQCQLGSLIKWVPDEEEQNGEETDG